MDDLDTAEFYEKKKQVIKERAITGEFITGWQACISEALTTLALAEDVHVFFKDHIKYESFDYVIPKHGYIESVLTNTWCWNLPELKHIHHGEGVPSSGTVFIKADVEQLKGHFYREGYPKMYFCIDTSYIPHLI